MAKVGDDRHVQNQAIYVVRGVDLEGQKEALGLWMAPTEGAKFWLQVLTELHNRSVAGADAGHGEGGTMKMRNAPPAKRSVSLFR